MIVSILLAAGWAARQGADVSVNVDLDARVSAIEQTLNMPVNSSLSAFRKSNSYLVSLVETYACFQRGSNGSAPEYSTNHTKIIQDCLDNASVSGGSVYVAEGSYSASVILKTNTRLVIEKGATGITIASVASNANCILDDFNGGVFKYYKNGALYTQFDYANGTQFWWQGENRTGALANTVSFSIIQISDTQFLSSWRPTYWSNLTAWILAYSQSNPLAMVIHTGDIVDNGSDTTQWTRANTSMTTLLDNGIPYSWDAGNHDQQPQDDPNSYWLGENYLCFNATYMSSKSYWVGSQFAGKSTATKFSYGSRDFIVINLEYFANSTVIAWMKSLISSNPTSNIIVATHAYLSVEASDYFTSGGSTWAETLCHTLDDYSNVFMVLCGHNYEESGISFAKRTPAGRMELLYDQQETDTEQGADSARIYEFTAVGNLFSVKAQTYFVYNNTYIQDKTNYFQFPVVVSYGQVASQIPATYVITGNSLRYFAYYGANNSLFLSSSNVITLSEYVFANLTSERTSKEKVVFKGTFIFWGSIKPYSYTVLDMTEANLTEMGGTNSPLAVINSTVHDVEIIGGSWNQNGISQSGGSGIDIRGSNVDVRNIYMTNVCDYGLDVEHNENIRVLDSTFANCSGDDDISIHNSKNVLIDNVLSINHTGSLAGASYSGFEIEDGSQYVIVSNCIAWFPNQTMTNHFGFHLHINANDEPTPSHCKFIGDQAIGMGSHGFAVDGTASSWVNGSSNEFDDCESDFAYLYGFRFQNAANVTVRGGSATNARHATQGVGVFVGSNCQHITVSGLLCNNNPVCDLKVYDTTGVDTVFEYCDLQSPVKIIDAGLRTVRHHCSGIPDPFVQLVYTVGEIDGSNALGTAGRAYMIPIEIPIDCYISKLGVVWGTTSAGNVTLGLYKSNTYSPASQALMAQTADLAKASANNAQEGTITETFVQAGLYFLVVESSETTSIILRASNPSRFNGGTYKACYFDVGGGYGALPSTCPAVSWSSSTIAGGYVIISRVP